MGTGVGRRSGEVGVAFQEMRQEQPPRAGRREGWREGQWGHGCGRRCRKVPSAGRLLLLRHRGLVGQDPESEAALECAP